MGISANFCCSWCRKDDGIARFLSEYRNSNKTTLTFNFVSKVKEGCLITITGTAPYGTDRFSVDFYCHEVDSYKDDIAFHFNPRLPLRFVVRNSLKNGMWGKEETTSFNSFPFQFDKPFRIEMLAAETRWIVAVDGELFCEFAYRLPLHTLERVEVVGLPNPALTVAKTDFFPIPKEKPLKVPHFSNASEVFCESKWPKNPRALLPHGIPVNNQIVLRGRLRKMPHSFIIELTNGIQDWPHVITVLHLNPRISLSSHKSRQLVILNTWVNGVWGVERKQDTGKFIGGALVEIRIVREPNNWTIWHDKLQIGTLSHVLNPDFVTAVRVRGDFYPSEIFTIPEPS